jgi:hypothetical protein
MAGIELGVSITALKPVGHVIGAAACHLFFSFLGLGLGGGFETYHFGSHLLVMCSRPRTPSGSSSFELMPLQTVEMAEVMGLV